MFAEAILRAKGFAILARRFRSPLGEVDLIAKRGALLIFAEVKARDSLASAAAAVSKANERRVSAAASMFLARRADLAQCDMRYDMIAIAGWRWRHIKTAWLDQE